MSATPRKPTARKTVVPVVRQRRELAGLPFGYSPESDEAQTSSRVTRARVSRRTSSQPAFSAQQAGPSGRVAAPKSPKPSTGRGAEVSAALRRRYRESERRAIARRDATVVSRGNRRGKFPANPDVEIRQPSPKKPAKQQSSPSRQLGIPDLTDEEPQSSETPSVRAQRDDEHLKRGGILYVPYNPKAPRPVYKTKQTARKRSSSAVFPRMVMANKNEIGNRQRADAVSRQAAVVSAGVKDAESEPSTSAGPYYLRSRGQKRKYEEVSSSSSSETDTSSSDDDDSDDPAAAVSADENADDEAEDDMEIDDKNDSDWEGMDVDPLPSLQPVVPAVPPVPAVAHEDSPEFAEPAIYGQQQPYSAEL
ncbi:uncharacterized protein LOC129598366 [Paramacrobiotus metropolitanus]|uniref:uncharacterized protein LOC129598366 n=1 Tax=Paramacrobiotus metropolitanus TaxID=2943436 RepID=UPI0024456315|nr:uncharacterized protein LOC129598366 [Paramacrobiotus metropolitanus]